MMAVMNSMLITCSIVFLFAQIHSNSACGPGSVKAREDLKKYLGLSWISNRYFVAEETDYTTDGYIERASDLDCDFSDPWSCQWANYVHNGTNDNLDDTEYYLFEKTSSQWRPELKPGREPRDGDMVLLAGHRGPANSKGAVLLSKPILCQQERGKLSFKYTLFRAAAVEVRIVRPGTKPLQLIPFKDRPIQSCFKGAPADTRCSVTIPKMDEPFQLAIRSFNFGREGMSIIDDIEYDAELCQNPFDLIGNSEDNESGLTGDPIDRTSQLQCDRFDGNCRWGNGRGNTVDWVNGLSGPKNPAAWKALTGTDAQPTPPFLMISTNGRDGRRPSGKIISDPMVCQKRDGNLKFRYWLTKGTELKACALEAQSLREIECETIRAGNAPGPANIQIRGPIQEEFVVSIEAVGFNNGAGGFAAIDDIDYTADICEPNFEPPVTEGPQPGEGDITDDLIVTDLEGGLTGENVENSLDLDCDFGGNNLAEEYDCLWGNGDGRNRRETGTWVVGSEINPDILDQDTNSGSNSIPDGSFGFIDFDESGEGSLYTDPMACQRGNGQLSLRYWLSEGTELDVCGVRLDRRSGRESESWCQTVASGPSSGDTSMAIRQSTWNKRPFKLKLKAKSRGDGYAVVDDLSYDAELCQKEATRPRTTTATTRRPRPTTRPTRRPRPSTQAPRPTRPPRIVDACRKLSCSVADTSSMCLFRSTGPNTFDPRFRVRRGKLPNLAAPIAVGNRYPNRYIGGTITRQGADRPGGNRATTATMIVLESSRFQLPQAGKLRFKYQRGTRKSEMWTCINSFNRYQPVEQQTGSCEKFTGILTQREFREPQTAVIDIPANARKVYIVGYHRQFERGNAGFLLTDLELLDRNDASLCD